MLSLLLQLKHLFFLLLLLLFIKMFATNFGLVRPELRLLLALDLLNLEQADLSGNRGEPVDLGIICLGLVDILKGGSEDSSVTEVKTRLSRLDSDSGIIDESPEIQVQFNIY
jgi:hypothetical protein